MKKIKDIICSLLVIFSFLVIIGCIIASMILNFKNPDMTDMRLFLTYPQPTIIFIISFIVITVSTQIFKNK